MKFIFDKGNNDMNFTFFPTLSPHCDSESMHKVAGEKLKARDLVVK